MPVRATCSEIWSPALANRAPQVTVGQQPCIRAHLHQRGWNLSQLHKMPILLTTHMQCSQFYFLHKSHLLPKMCNLKHNFKIKTPFFTILKVFEKIFFPEHFKNGCQIKHRRTYDFKTMNVENVQSKINITILPVNHTINQDN